jgi:hypothetical protein
LLVIAFRSSPGRLVGLLAAGGLAALVGVLPVMINLVRSTARVVESGTNPEFALFYRVMHERLLTLFPLPASTLNFFGHLVVAREQKMLLAVYGVAMLACLGFYYGRQKQVGWETAVNELFLPLLWLQLPLAYLLTEFRFHTLILYLLVYTLFLVGKEADRWDWLLLGVMILAVNYSLLVVYLMDWLWWRFELWPLTSWVGEQMRVARFVYLPLYLFMARFLAHLAANFPDGWPKTGLLVTLAVLPLLPVTGVAFTAAVFCTALLLQQRSQRGARYPWWLPLVMEVVALTAVAHTLFTIFGIDARVAVYLTAVYGVVRFMSQVMRDPTVTGRSIAGSAVGVLLLLTAMISLQPLSLSVIQAVPQQIARIGTVELSPQRQQQLELYQWAREQTGQDTLFYTSSLEFRFAAERSITHAWKDLGLAYYSRVHFIPFYERYYRLQAAYENEALLLEAAGEYAVDYIIVEYTKHLVLNLPVAFQNQAYTVYALGQ